MRSSGITVYTETSNSFIPFILHEEIHEILPVLILQKTKSSSSNSTCRRQGDLLSSLQRPTRHSRHSSRKTLHRHSSSTRTFQTFQSFMTFQPYRHYYTFQHLQYNPVPSGAIQCIQCIQGFYPFQHFFNQNANSTHRLVYTRNSIECQSNTGHYITTNFHSSKKGRCCDIGQTLTYSPE